MNETTPTTSTPEPVVVEQEPKPLFPIVLEIENCMGIKAFFYDFRGKSKTTVLTGKNGAGKSSAINVFSWLLLGKEAMPDRPLRDGATKGHAFLDLDDITMQMDLSISSSPRFVVKAKDGQRLKSPGAVADALWNKMCDPVKFIRLGDTPDGRRKQSVILQQIVGLDFSQHDAAREAVFEQRKDKNREVGQLRARLGAMHYDDTAPAEETSITKLMETLKRYQTKNRENKEFRDKREDLVESADKAGRSIEDCDASIVALEKQINLLKANRGELVKIKTEADAMVVEHANQVATLVDANVDAIETEIRDSDAINRQVKANATYRQLKDALEAAEASAALLTSTLENYDAERQEKLARAKFPLPGLEYTDEGIHYNKLPFNQINDAEKLRIGAAIGLALKPRLRVIIIREASFFDEQALQEMREWAERENFHLIEEVNRTDDPAAIIIENGEIKPRKADPVTEPKA